MGEGETSGLATIILAGNAKIKRQLRRRRRRGLLYRISHPSLWRVDRKKLESSLASKINRDDYIVGENKALLYLHPDLISQNNINFLKRVLYFAGKTGDRIYRKNKRYLLEYLSGKGEASISIVLRAVHNCRQLDDDLAVVVGPSKQIRRELKRAGITGFKVREQGNSIGENILKGKNTLSDIGYHKKQLLVLGGDLPLVNSENLGKFIEKALEREGDPDIRFGMGSRQQLKKYIEDHELTSLGSVGPNYPKAGNLNKFGIPLIDDIGLFSKKNARNHLMMGNMFLVKFQSVDRRFIDRFYSLRKMGANPLTYPYLAYKFGYPIFKALRWKMKVTDAERTFKKATGVDVKVAPVTPDLTLDLDSYSDLRRLSALYFHRMRTSHDLEKDLKEYLKRKRTEKKRSRRSEGGAL